MQKQLAELMDDQKANQALMIDQTKTADERLKEIEEEEVDVKRVDKTKPHLSNLNEDPQLNLRLNYSLAQAETSVGKKKDEYQPDIILNGLGIKPKHCIFINDGEKVFISLEGKVTKFWNLIFTHFFLGGSQRLHPY